MAARPPNRHSVRVDVEGPVIYREEVVGMLFTLADVSENLRIIRALLGGDDEEEEAAADEDARQEANIRRLRELAEKAQADLDRRKREASA
jgi:hypothetical protein